MSTPLIVVRYHGFAYIQTHQMYTLNVFPLYFNIALFKKVFVLTQYCSLQYFSLNSNGPTYQYPICNMKFPRSHIQ